MYKKNSRIFHLSHPWTENPYRLWTSTTPWLWLSIETKVPRQIQYYFQYKETLQQSTLPHRIVTTMEKISFHVIVFKGTLQPQLSTVEQTQRNVHRCKKLQKRLESHLPLKYFLSFCRHGNYTQDTIKKNCERKNCTCPCPCPCLFKEALPGYVDGEERQPAEYKAADNDPDGFCRLRLHLELSHLQ